MQTSYEGKTPQKSLITLQEKGLRIIHNQPKKVKLLC